MTWSEQCVRGKTSQTPGMERLQIVEEAKPPFEVLVRTYASMVLRVCRAVAGSDEADDAWSETFLAALKAYPRLPGDANVEAWLVTIAHRRSIDVVRARKRRPEPVPTLPEGAQRTPQANDLREGIDAAFGALTPRQRQAVACHYVAGLPYRDVAKVIGGSEDAVRRAAADGIARLRQLDPAVFSETTMEDS